MDIKKIYLKIAKKPNIKWGVDTVKMLWITSLVQNFWLYGWKDIVNFKMWYHKTTTYLKYTEILNHLYYLKMSNRSNTVFKYTYTFFLLFRIWEKKTTLSCEIKSVCTTTTRFFTAKVAIRSVQIRLFFCFNFFTRFRQSLNVFVCPNFISKITSILHNGLGAHRSLSTVLFFLCRVIFVVSYNHSLCAPNVFNYLFSVNRFFNFFFFLYKLSNLF